MGTTDNSPSTSLFPERVRQTNYQMKSYTHFVMIFCLRGNFSYIFLLFFLFFHCFDVFTRFRYYIYYTLTLCDMYYLNRVNTINLHQKGLTFSCFFVGWLVGLKFNPTNHEPRRRYHITFVKIISGR